MLKHYILILLFFIGLVWSGIHPHDYFTWLLEVFPALIGLMILILTFKKFQFTFLTYSMILFHSTVLFIGGHYTYAEVPLFDWVQELFHQTRNNYDKVGHFTQGFVPAIIARELFLRLEIIKLKKWTSFFVVCVCATISMFYEFLEWFVAVFSGQSSDAFLGTQGYVWDTQSDMLYATIGAICTVLFLSKYHDKQIRNLIASK